MHITALGSIVPSLVVQRIPIVMTFIALLNNCLPRKCKPVMMISKSEAKGLRTMYESIQCTSISQVLTYVPLWKILVTYYVTA